MADDDGLRLKLTVGSRQGALHSIRLRCAMGWEKNKKSPDGVEEGWLFYL